MYWITLLVGLQQVFGDQEEIQRDFCTLPNPIYADGVTTAKFGTQWNYVNAEHWKDFIVTCGGSHQSPINIVTSKIPKEAAQFSISYKTKSPEVEYEEVNLPYTKEYEGEYSEVEVTDASNNFNSYFAKQFHIHTPSEHTIDGKEFDLEIHFVHQAIQDDEQDCNQISNKLTVFGLMFTSTDGTEDYDVFKPWFDTYLTGEVKQFDLNDFFEKMDDLTYYHYNGSLTTPPCSETVNWVVFRQALPINPAQLKSFKKMFADDTQFPLKHNNRPIQHLNDRNIVKGKAKLYEEEYLPDLIASWGQILLLTIGTNILF